MDNPVLMIISGPRSSPTETTSMTKETGVSKITPQKELVCEEQSLQAQNSADLLLSQAVANNLPVESLEKLIALRTRMKAESAKEAFDLAMSDFQGECPIIKKNKKVKDNSSKELYAFASIDSIVSQVKPILTKYGLSYSIQTETLENKVKSICIAKHKLGHSETSTMEVPLGTKTAVMSQTQVVAAALTFAKRYAFCNAFGIMTGDDDNEKVLQEKAEKKDTTNYIDKLRMALYKMGSKNLAEAITVFNEKTGASIKAMPTTQKAAQEMLEILNSQVIEE